MKDRTPTYVALAILLLAFIQFVVLPTIRIRTSAKVIHSILTDWKEANNLTPMSHWANRDKYPYMPQLQDYKIRNRQILKKNEKLIARYTVKLLFDQRAAMPKMSEWLFVLSQIQGRWKVVDFRFHKMHPEDIKHQVGQYDAVKDRAYLRRMEQQSQRGSSLRPEQQTATKEEESSKMKPLRPVSSTADGPQQRAPNAEKRPGYKVIPALVD